MFRSRGSSRYRQAGVLLLAQQLLSSGPIPPITLLFILLQAGIYTGFIPFMDPDKTHNLCLLPRAILKKKQWYRIFLPLLMHGDDLHLYYNMISLLYKGKNLERLLGSIKFLSILITFIISTPLVHLFLSWAGEEILDMDNFMHECTVGFSAYSYGEIKRDSKNIMKSRVSEYEFLNSPSSSSTSSFKNKLSYNDNNDEDGDDDISYFYDKYNVKNIIIPNDDSNYLNTNSTLKKFPISQSFYPTKPSKLSLHKSKSEKVNQKCYQNLSTLPTPYNCNDILLLNKSNTSPSTCRTTLSSESSSPRSSLNVETSNSDYSNVTRSKNYKIPLIINEDGGINGLSSKIDPKSIDNSNLENIKYKYNNNSNNILKNHSKYCTFSNEDFLFSKKINTMVKVKPQGNDYYYETCKKESSKRCGMVLGILFGLVSFLMAIGFMIALIIVATNKDHPSCDDKNVNIFKVLLYEDTERGNSIGDEMLNEWNGENIKNSIKWLSSKIHVAGSENNMVVMNHIEKEFKELGLEVTTQLYDVLLDYPNYDKPNTISHCSKQNNCEVLSNGLSDILGDGELASQLSDDYRSKVQWLAYAKNGTVTGSVVYANYGKLDDYEILDKKGISLKDKIVIVRYGGNFRADKVNMAAVRGAIGVIIYSDPHEYAPLLKKDNETFPHNIYLSNRGVQRGTLLKFDGDPLTPYFPSKDYVMRTNNEKDMREKNLMPNIPATPIGYGDAVKIFNLMDGPKVDVDGWNGSMDTIYRFSGSAKITLDVHSGTVKRQIKNVIGRFVGSEEPDKWIMLGNHVDAWVKGSIDPNSGTGTLLEAARVLTEVSKKNKWKPRRSIVFCAWDAEEYGLIGSTEFVEEYMKILQNKAVAYLNVDNINGNNTLLVKTVPMLYRSIVNAAKKIPHPNPDDVKQGLKTLYDGWQHYNPKGPLSGDKSVPEVKNPGSGSDFQRFISYIGVPVLDLKMQAAPFMNYMLYHTMYEVPWTTENLIDPTTKVFSSLGSMWLELSRNIADSLIIPFNIEDYSIKLDDFVNQMDIILKTNEIDKAIGSKKYSEKMDYLKDAIKRFNGKAISLQDKIEGIKNGNIGVTLIQKNMINNILQNMEKNFIIEQGIYPERALYRHAVFAPNQHDSYSGKVFSLILDPATEYKNYINKGDVKEAKKWLDVVELGFTKLQYGIESAILNMDIGDF
uniref:Peptidase M28 domain-containing protein n=1 Tax=Strongyloides stercoralis TaxID=6248 RepID=A0A0K0EN07_STRER